MILIGCNSVGLGYYFGGSYLLSTLDDYLNLTDSQRQWLEPSLQGHLQWHKQNELPIYIANLASWQEMLADNLTETEANQIVQHIDSAYLRFANRITADSVTIMEQLSVDQLDYLDNFLKEKRAKRLQKQSKKTNQTKYADFKERMESWFGEFSQAQDKQLQTMHKMWQTQRQASGAETESAARLDAMMEFLKSQPSQSQLNTWLSYWFVHWQMLDSVILTHDRSPALEAQEGDNVRQQGFQKIGPRLLQIDALLTLKQRKFFIQKLQSWLNKMRTTLD